jgi:hypothetical protein
LLALGQQFERQPRRVGERTWPIGQVGDRWFYEANTGSAADTAEPRARDDGAAVRWTPAGLKQKSEDCHTVYRINDSFVMRCAERLRQGSRKLSIAISAGALAATSLLTPQPVGATGYLAHFMTVRYDWLQLTQVSDGCCPDNTLELYGSLSAHTPQPPYSQLPFRNFGTWGQDPCEKNWGTTWTPGGGTCSRKTTVGTWQFSALLFCQSSTYDLCTEDPADSHPFDSTIPLTILSGETFTFDVRIRDYDALSSDDDVCVTSLTVGPFTDAQIDAFKTTPFTGTFGQPWNGSGACKVHVTMWEN